MSSASDMNRGSAFLYKGEVLKVVKKEVVAVGTHSHTKLKFYAKPLFGGGEKVITLAHNDKVDMVDAQKKMATIIAKMPEKLQIMDSKTYETFDAEATPEIIEEVKEGDSVVFVDYNGKTVVIEKSNKDRSNESDYS